MLAPRRRSAHATLRGMAHHESTPHEYPTVLCNPGPLLSNIPAILGFYPHESLLLLALERRHHEKTGRYALGPVLRVDLADDEAVNAVIDMAATPGSPLDCDLLFGVIVSSDEPRIAAVAENLDSALDMPLAACWLVPEILTGEPYSMLFGPEDTGEGDPWAGGRLPEIVGAASMTPFHRAGTLPETSREEAVDKLTSRSAHRTAVGAEDMQAVMEAIVAPFGALPQQHGDDHDLLELAEEAAWAVEGVEDPGDQLAMTEAAERDPLLLADVGLPLAHVRTRDFVLHMLADAGTTTAPVLLAVARTFTGLVRANALTAYAVLQTHHGLPMLAQHALMVAAEEFPEHVLSAYLLEGSLIGRLSEMSQAVIEESRRIADQVLEQCDC